MKKLLLILAFVLLVVSVAMAGQQTVTFTWRQVITPDFGGWKMYMDTSPGVQPGVMTLIADIVYDGIEVTDYEASHIILAPDNAETTYYFILTAYDKFGNESSPTPEVVHTADFVPPGTPIQFKIKIVGQ